MMIGFGMGGQLGPRVYQLVDAWVPEKAYRSESKFQADLQNFLEAEFNSGGGGLFGSNRTYAIRRERGNARADITVDDEVGIELKRDVTNSGLRRLRDQIHDYAREYPYVIICACGLKQTGKWNEFRQEYEGQQGGLGFQQGPVIRFVEKHKDGGTFTGSNGRGGPGGGNPFGDFGLDFNFEWSSLGGVI